MRRRQQSSTPARYPASAQSGMQRRDVPVSRTRVVTNRQGEKYEIPDDSALSLSLMKRHRKNRKGRGCLIAVVYALIVCSVSALLSFYLIVGINDMFGLVKTDTEIVVEIPQNATLSEVTDILADNGVVDYPFFFKIYAQISNDDDFQAGTFTLNSKSDYSRLITKLTLPANAVDGVIRVTIPEGYSVDQIAQLFEENCVCTKEAFYQTLQEYQFKHKFMPLVAIDENRLYRLEGYLYPATYDFYIWEGSKWGINRLLNAFQENVMDNTELDIQGAAQSLGVSVDDIITLASVIERETYVPEEMKNVASVFYNRMNNPSHDGTGGKLQSDATIWYPYRTRADFEQSDLSEAEKESFVSAYDTTVYAGLPVGPICNPSYKAIYAAAHPNKTNYYYFFIDDNDKHYYASTFAEHQANIDAARAAGTYSG